MVYTQMAPCYGDVSRGLFLTRTDDGHHTTSDSMYTASSVCSEYGESSLTRMCFVLRPTSRLDLSPTTIHIVYEYDDGGPHHTIVGLVSAAPSAHTRSDNPEMWCG